MTDKEMLNKLIDAWESLPGGRNYSPDDIEDWLRRDMARAINAARRHLNRKKPTA
jgi:hypothetical protein